MAKKKSQLQRTKPQNPQESTTSTSLLKGFYLLSFIGYGLLVFNDLPLNWILGLLGLDIIVSLVYVVLNKSRVTTSTVVHTNVRHVVSFLIMIITMFFYAFALWRVDQYNPEMQVTLFVGGAIIYYSVLNSTKNVLK